MGNSFTLCFSSSNKIYPIKKNKSKKSKKSKKISKKKSKKSKKSKHSNYIVIPQQSINNIYYETQV